MKNKTLTNFIFLTLLFVSGFLLVPEAYALISYDAGSHNTDAVPDNTHEWEHTTGAGATIMLVLVGNPTMTAVSYDSEALTKIITTSSDRWTMWYLLNPNPGTHNIVATSSNSDNLAGGAITLFGTRTDVSVIGNMKNDGTTAGSPVSKTLTTEDINSWIISGCFANGGNSSVWGVSGTNQTQRFEQTNWADLQVHGGTQSTESIGTYEQIWTYSGSATALICMGAEIKTPPSITEAYSVQWRYPTSTGSINITDSLGFRAIQDYIVSSTYNAYLRYRISTSTDFAQYIYDSGPIRIYNNATQGEWTTLLNTYPETTYEPYFPTSTSVYMKAWIYTTENPLVNIRTSSTILVYLNTTTTPEWYTGEDNYIESIAERLLSKENCGDGLWDNLRAGSWMCHIRNLVKYTIWLIFVPKESQDFLGDAFENFSETFPFALVFGTADKVQDYIASSTSTGLDSITLQFSGNSHSPTSTITILSSSTLSNGFSQAFKNAWANFVLIVLSTCMVVALIMMI